MTSARAVLRRLAVPLAAVIAVTVVVVLAQDLRGAAAPPAAPVWDLTAPDAADRIRADGFTLVDRGRNASPARVGPSGLQHGPAVKPDALAYLQRRLSGPLGRIGASVTFEPDTAGSVVLIAPAAALPPADRLGAQPLDAGVYVVVDPLTWTVGVWEGAGGLDVLAGGAFAARLVGTVGVDVVRRGDRMTVTLPDGSAHTVTDPRVAALTADWAGWELFESKPNDVGAAIAGVWAVAE